MSEQGGRSSVEKIAGLVDAFERNPKEYLPDGGAGLGPLVHVLPLALPKLKRLLPEDPEALDQQLAILALWARTAVSDGVDFDALLAELQADCE